MNIVFSIIKNLFFIISFTFAPIITFQLLHAEKVMEEKNILIEEWVENYRNEKDKDIKWREREKRENEVNSFTEMGIKFYRKKNDIKAIEEYIKAILIYPTSTTYYHYANSLTNTHRIPDAINAYKIALKFDDSNKALVYYNLACAYSRLNQLEESKANLHLAIENGYSAIQQIKKDPDLENLRRLSGWDKELNGLLKAHNITKSTLIGEIYEQGPRSGDSYYLCSNGYFIHRHEYDCNEKYKGFSRGRWELISNKVETHFTEFCFLNYETTAKLRKHYDGSEVPTECYGTPKFAECKKNTRNYKQFFSYKDLYEAINAKPEKK
ncbi:hypothetical protein EHQ68_09145 [Leptospira congkakensis]|uniref:Tetratricopeptide repeat protein n=1 Tax=Leptospira congkakensis TaxID=2484932 RepID=A0A4Z1A4G0_9LEPT|nr:hypothetical protein [Leptospira congkakensis]TGL88791.1 hypothetical protein EHQ69_15215 [Leptospira congkakensis]TGL89377.1 hypothetical protein EHQ68_09145 [Leptospira congkakensis]TGL97345.1 hypothetical protein EHQ70_08640 [Leptospira congkakensis]